MNIYFSGIGGVGIGPLAEIARDAGNQIIGSDAGKNRITDRLEASGVTVSTDQSGGFLREMHASQPFDWFVYTAALPDSHPELVAARELGIKTAKRDELLNEIIKSKGLKLIAVAGTHGKTTTTGMVVWAMKELGIPVSYSVGTTLSFGPSGLYDPTSEYFIYECDEFDRNFLHFTPHLALITSVDYDHPDTYPTVDDYKQSFRQFLGQSDMQIVWQKDADYLHYMSNDAWCLQPSDVPELGLAGAHNRANATLVIKALERLGLDTNGRSHAIMEAFPGTDRRFERLAENLYSDYGHHPIEIAATLQLAREISDNVVLVYQPHQNMRQHEIKDQYIDCFDLASEIYWLPTYLSREDTSLEVLTPDQLTAKVIHPERIHNCQLDDELWSAIARSRAEGKLVLCMGAGSIDAWIRDQIEKER